MATRPSLATLTDPYSERSTQLRKRLAVLAGLFLGCIFLAFRATQLSQPALLLEDPVALALPILIVLLVLMRWPLVGLVGLVAAGLVIPFQISTGTQTRMNAAMLLVVALVGLGIFELIVQKRRISLLPSRTVIPLLLFLGSAVLSFSVGQLPWFVFAQKASLAAQAGGLAVFILAACAFLLVAIQVRDVRWLEWMTWLYLALGALHIVWQLVPGLRSLKTDIVLAGAYRNSVFWIWLTVLTFSQLVFNRKLHPFWRACLVVLLLGVLYISLVRDRDWTSGWLPAAFGVIVSLWVGGSSWVWAAMFVGAGLAATKFDRIQALVLEGNQYSLSTRLEAWRLLAEMLRVSPLLGLGPANYYWYTPLFSILGYSVTFNSHNNYVDIVAQTGLIGLVLFLWFVFELARVGWRLRGRVPEGFPQAFLYGVMGGLGATLVAGMLGDWFLPFIYNIGFNGFRVSILGWAFLGGIVALEQIYLRPAETQGQEAVG